MKQVDKDIMKHFNALKKLFLKKGLQKVELNDDQKVLATLVIQNEKTDEVLGHIKTWFTKEELE